MRLVTATRARVTGRRRRRDPGRSRSGSLRGGRRCHRHERFDDGRVSYARAADESSEAGAETRHGSTPLLLKRYGRSGPDEWASGGPEPLKLP